MVIAAMSQTLQRLQIPPTPHTTYLVANVSVSTLSANFVKNQQRSVIMTIHATNAEGMTFTLDINVTRHLSRIDFCLFREHVLHILVLFFFFFVFMGAGSIKPA